MTNHDYWQTMVGDQSPEEFLRAYGTADPDLGLERFLEDRGQLYGIINQGSWANTFVAPAQYTVLTAQVYLRSYLEETREAWEPALEAQPPKVIRRYRPVYDLPVPPPAVPEAKGDDVAVPTPSAENNDVVDDVVEKSDESNNGDGAAATSPADEATPTLPTET